MNKIKDLTLIVPTYNRPKYAIRQLNYWSETGVCLHVLDGSNESINESLYDKSNPNVNYHHLSNTSIEDRFGYAINLINTKYSALISDDEFFIPSGIEKCITNIEVNNLVACKGLCFLFNYINGNVLGEQIYKPTKGHKINADTSLNRMMQHMLPYHMASLWSIMKSDVTIACLEAASLTGKLSSAACMEIQTSLITSFLGSIEVIDELFWLRSLENENIWKKDGKLSFYDLYTSPVYKNEINHFLETTAYVLSKKVGLSKEKIRKELIQVLNQYKKYCNRITFKKVKYHIIYPSIEIIKRLLPSIISNYLRKLYHQKTNIRHEKKLSSSLMESINKKMGSENINKKEIQNIIKYISNTHSEIL